MDLSLTESQELFKSTARQFVTDDCPKELLLDLDGTGTGFTDGLWQKAAGLGWLGMLVPEAYGGSGNSLTDAAVVFEELGRGPVPGPFFSSAVLGALTVIEAAGEEQKRDILPGLADGTRILCLAVTEPDFGWGPEHVQLRATRRDGGYVLNGTKLFVHDGAVASDIICTARTEGGNGRTEQGISLLAVSATASGVSVRVLPGFTTGVTEVVFDSVEVPETALLGADTGTGWPSLERAMLRALPVLCAYKVGACQAVFELSVEYSRTREQFGMPIGRFQRVQDHIIRMVNRLDAARWTTYEALWKLDTGRNPASSVHMAKALASQAYLEVCDAAHEVHAGIGIVREYGLTLHTKMSRSLYHCLGDPRHHKRRLAAALAL